MPPENDQPLNNDVQIAPSVDNVIDLANPPEAPKIEGADTFAAFEAAQKAAEAAGEPGLFAAPPSEKPAADKPPEGDKPTEAAADKPPEGDKPPAPKKSAQERISELVRRNKDSERAVAAKDAELQELRERLAAVERGERRAPTEVDEGPKAPSPDDKNPDGTEKYRFGELDTAYIRDLAKHEALQTVREERTREDAIRQQQAAAAQAEEAEQVWADRLEAAAAKHPDFVEKVFDGAAAGKWPLNKEVDALIKDSEVGAEIAYHLATNLREAVALDRITDPLERARVFGRLEATLQAGTAKPKPTVKVPSAEPPAPQARGANGHFTGTPTSFKDFEAKYQPVLDAANR